MTTISERKQTARHTVRASNQATQSRGSTTRATSRSATPRHPVARVTPRSTSRAATSRSTLTSLATKRRYGLIVMLYLLTFAFCMAGLLMVLSSSMVADYDSRGSALFHFRRQLIWMGIGLVVLIVTSMLDYRRWARYANGLLLASFALLGLVLVPGLGVTVNGATRWLQFGPLAFQPAEVAKFALIVWLAKFLAGRHEHIDEPRLIVRPVVLVLALMSFLILAQPSLGSVLVIATIAFTLLLVAGSPLLSMLRWGLVGAGGVFLLAISADYRRRRLTSFWDIWDDPFGSDYQVIQSIVGIASGGVNGVGLGAGRSKWGYLPFSNTDFIFAVIAEELGFLGACITISMFLCFGIVGIYIALRAPNTFAALLTVGFVSWIVVQFFVNVGANIGLLPITGLPVPFLSFGGSALVFNMAAIGVIINIAKAGLLSRAEANSSHRRGAGRGVGRGAGVSNRTKKA